MIYLAVFASLIFLLSALALKWELEKKIAIPWSVLMGVLACLTLLLLNKSSFHLHSIIKLIIVTFQAVLISGIAILIMFFRDPERIPPVEDGVILSPADGKIKYVKKIQNGEFPFVFKGKKTISLSEFTGKEFIKDGGIQIGIGLNLMDIHVNRCPVNGTISFLKRIPGKFHSLKNISSLLENERVFAIVKGDTFETGLVLIASRLVRRISFYLKEGENVHIGQRIGMIRFGSQVDILLPNIDTLRIGSEPGEKVTAGVSILATY